MDNNWNLLCGGSLPHSCHDGSRLWIDRRDIAVFDGVHSIPQVKPAQNHHYSQIQMFCWTSPVFLVASTLVWLRRSWRHTVCVQSSSHLNLTMITGCVRWNPSSPPQETWSWNIHRRMKGCCCLERSWMSTWPSSLRRIYRCFRCAKTGSIPLWIK